MGKKNDILNAWIMVEHLSEGGINLREKEILTWNRLEGENYYGLFMDEMRKKKMHPKQKGGVVLYFDIFPFSEVITFLRETYHLKAAEEEIPVGDKFSFALYFNKELKLNEDMTFLTASFYIRKYLKIPKESEFSEFENRWKKDVEELFAYSDEEGYANFFNIAMYTLLQKNGIQIKDCRMKVLLNLETDAANLHSFFVHDLEKAKTISSRNLDKYLLGEYFERVDLNSHVQSPGFNPKVFFDILKPKYYPNGRFPSNPQFALSLMQQVAVNLSIGYDVSDIRSVNGPPGTGKTTLLKDIFAELVVRQAYEMALLDDKTLKGSEQTKYWERASLGIVTDKITQNGIVVASSNNGAVQNIVMELPLLSGIDSMFQEDILKADYFKKLANAKLSSKWEKDEKGVSREILIMEASEEEKYWGLFSLEGGRKENITNILTTIKHVVHWLETEYVPDEEVYQNFKRQYDRVKAYKEERQRQSEELSELEQAKKTYKQKESDFEREREKRHRDMKEEHERRTRTIGEMQSSCKRLEQSIQDGSQRLEQYKEEKEDIQSCITALQMQKPGFFSSFKTKREFKERNANYAKELETVLLSEREIKSQIREKEEQMAAFMKRISLESEEISKKRNAFAKWEDVQKRGLEEAKVELERQWSRLEMQKVRKPNFDLDYDDLQLSNPWFDDEYRILQSRLFITALQVRKQFLFENIKNLKAACRVWNQQKEYIEKKEVIHQAWNWINLVIPVISSTFASFSRMCSNLGMETLGYLFVDEAGQALPQASVGAIFRSKKVMVVGDPSQIKPVLTLDSFVLAMLAEYYGVSRDYLSEDASTQTLVDAISPYGFYKNAQEWIGIPLWVHRRCKHPMFDIANRISYGNHMVQGAKVRGHARWFDIPGSANDKYVKEQGFSCVRKYRN